MTQLLRTPLTRPTALRGAAVVLAGLLALTACGGSDEDAGAAAPPAGTTSPAAPPTAADAPPTAAEVGSASTTASLVDFAIELGETDLAAGDLEFEVSNDGDGSHDLVIERDGEDVAATEVLDPGGSETLAVTLEPGEYVFYCSVGTHRSMGMEITVTVS